MLMMKLLTLHLLKKDLMMVLMIGLPCLMLALPVLVVQVGLFFLVAAVHTLQPSHACLYW